MEYALIASLVAIVMAGGAAVVGPSLAGTFTGASGGVANGSASVTEGTQGMCDGVSVADPVTCDPATGVSVAGVSTGC